MCWNVLECFKHWIEIYFTSIIITKEPCEMQDNASGSIKQSLFSSIFFHLIEINVRKCILIYAYLTGRSDPLVLVVSTVLVFFFFSPILSTVYVCTKSSLPKKRKKQLRKVSK